MTEHMVRMCVRRSREAHVKINARDISGKKFPSASPSSPSPSFIHQSPDPTPLPVLPKAKKLMKRVNLKIVNFKKVNRDPEKLPNSTR